MRRHTEYFTDGAKAEQAKADFLKRYPPQGYDSRATVRPVKLSSGATGYALDTSYFTCD